jgi:hypothetical protein
LTRPAIRQALLRPEFAHLYPGIPANEWQPAAVMMAQVLALSPQRLSQASGARQRALDERHFEFRGVASWGAGDAVRQARQEERRRRLAAE